MIDLCGRRTRMWAADVPGAIVGAEKRGAIREKLVRDVAA